MATSPTNTPINSFISDVFESSVNYCSGNNESGTRCGAGVRRFPAPLVGHQNPSKHSVLSLCVKVRKQSYLPLVLRGPGHGSTAAMT